MKNNKLANFILEISQVFLVFLGVYSALMCAVLSLSLPVNRLAATLVLLGGAFLFYGLFTVLETFHNGKLYGILGISVFYLLVYIRLRTVINKGVVTIVNTYLKEFMNYAQTNFSLLPNSSFAQETAGVGYCVTLVIVLIGVYLTAIISCCFYRKRRSMVYIAATVFFFFVPVTVGKIGYFSNVSAYIFTSMAVVGTRFLRADTTDKRMRQKLSLVLACVGVIAGTLSYLFISPERYNNNKNQIVEVKNSALALVSWDKEDMLTWFREYFNGDMLEYGHVGKKNSVVRTGKTMFKISGNFDTNHGLYLKGYTGAVYSDGRWRQVKDDEGQYAKERDELAKAGLSVDNWHVTLRNQIGDSQTTGNDKLWISGKLTIRNLAFGYGNYIQPYYPTTAFSSVGGRMEADVPGIQYEVEYFPYLYTELKNGLAANSYNLAGNEYWTGSEENRKRLSDFVKKYYLDVPEETTGVVENYKAYLNSRDGLLDKFEKGEVSVWQVVEETRNYIMMDTKYTLSPGKTPKDKDVVAYFLEENKKGYCGHYATAAAVLLKSVGIPTRYAEGVYISREKLADLNGSLKEMKITDKEIHAWVEVYQENYGFVPVEVTPGIGEDEADQSPVTEEDGNGEGKQGGQDGGDAQDEAALQTPTPPPEEDMEFENIETEDYNRETEEEEETVSDGAVSAEDDNSQKDEGHLAWWKIVLWCIAALAALILAVEGQRRVRMLLFKNNLKKRNYKRQILLCYRHLERALNQEGVRYKGQSVAEYAEDIAKAYGIKYEEVYEFVAMVFCASFSREQFDKGQMIGFRSTYRLIRSRIYARLKGFKKLYYMYILAF
ncbi:MAG: transglutaminase domain-containing protein [Roseburia sp.]|nr:transglutaminase domain-containing protein [Roseburia sp.]